MSVNFGSAKKTGLIWRALLEIGSVMVFSYAVLLMREFIKSAEPGKTLAYALKDIFTFGTVVIATVSGVVGCIIAEYLRKQNEGS